MLEPTTGILLIAEPFLKDTNFMRTVVLLCDHQEEGSFGFVLNKHIKHTLDEIIPELEGIKIPLFFGGPVQADTLHFLHVCPDQIPGSHEVTDGIYWGGDFGIIKDLLLKNKLNQKDIRFYIGYSGWGSNQLNEELKGKSWITTMAKQDLVFNYNAEDIWKESLKLLGDEYSLMINFPIDPQLN
jgi:putative transcriptional regulator